MEKIWILWYCSVLSVWGQGLKLGSKHHPLYCSNYNFASLLKLHCWGGRSRLGFVLGTLSIFLLEFSRGWGLDWLSHILVMPSWKSDQTLLSQDLGVSVTLLFVWSLLVLLLGHFHRVQSLQASVEVKVRTSIEIQAQRSTSTPSICLGECRVLQHQQGCLHCQCISTGLALWHYESLAHKPCLFYMTSPIFPVWSVDLDLHQGTSE